MPRKKPTPKPHELAHMVTNYIARRAEEQGIPLHEVGLDSLDMAVVLGVGFNPPNRLWAAYKAVSLHILTTMQARGELVVDKLGWYHLPTPTETKDVP